jgi:hypothetical protein
MADIRPNRDIAVGEAAASVPGRSGPGVMQTFQDHWWRDNYSTLDGLQADRGYDYYDPAFRYGWESAGQHRGRRFADVESNLSTGWSSRPARQDARWEDVRHAVRHSFERAMHVFEGMPDPDKRK